jgi:hypothetical protein
MLILKGNFTDRKSFAPWLAALLAAMLACVCALVPAAVSSAAPAAAPAAMSALARVPARAPDVVAADFYGWYLDALSADQDPLSDRYDRFGTYVAKALVDQLAVGLRSGPALPAAAPAGDYFLKTRSYRAAWLRARPRALTVRKDARQAEVLVTLGEGSDARRLLGLGMVLENGGWKIRQVVRADPEGLESSAEPPDS